MRTHVREGARSAPVFRAGAAAGLAVVVGAVAWLALPRAAVLDVSRPYQVRSGDTVWDLATDFVASNEDVRPVVDAILDANGLGAPDALQAGVTILLPAAGEGVAAG